MHELSIALGIIDMLEENGYLKNVKKVGEILLTVGEYSGIDKNYLEFAFHNSGDKRFKSVSLQCFDNETDDIRVNEIIVD